MRREQDFEGIEQRRRLTGALQQLVDLLFVLLRDGGDHRFLVLEVAINEAHADLGLLANVLHARLVKAALGEANHGGLQDLGPALKSRFQRDLRHRKAH
jgi:hypothetical protein